MQIETHRETSVCIQRAKKTEEKRIRGKGNKKSAFQ